MPDSRGMGVRAGDTELLLGEEDNGSTLTFRGGGFSASCMPHRLAEFTIKMVCVCLCVRARLLETLELGLPERREGLYLEMSEGGIRSHFPLGLQRVSFPVWGAWIPG